jgi:hypothetical protein
VRHSGHSLQPQNLFKGELTVCGQSTISLRRKTRVRQPPKRSRLWTDRRSGTSILLGINCWGPVAITYLSGDIIVERGKHRLLDPLNQLSILTASICIASAYFLDGHVAVKEGDFLAAESNQFPLDVRLPLYGPVQLALKGLIPSKIEIGFHSTPSIKKIYKKNTPGLKDAIMNAVTPIFVNFYENSKPFLVTKFGSNSANWPPVWDFARVVRNACSHGGKLSMTSANRQVTWHHLTYEQSMHGQQIVGGDFAFCDVLVLMFELSDNLDQEECPVLATKIEH